MGTTHTRTPPPPFHRAMRVSRDDAADADLTARVAGARGVLRSWTLDNRTTVLRSDADFERAMAQAVADGKDWLFEILCDVQDHLGQRCVAVEAYTVAGDQPTICVRFADGWELYAWSGDVRFD